ncbi:hypothetical protein BcDW1_6339 [Botrytis cinerea BcDW1]|uniref:Uncharacterized protein n=1 Tax=Botryotinia fuckeliana (strain BcDW1) TaxID=1290391 RepID=M7TUR2_BOTF1|nr:hypothetical protein BcDW1_6339 [Botrytis cinerea BcDW1]
MTSSSNPFVLSRPISSPYASLIARRRPAPAPAPVDVDFTVRLSVWKRGSCQTNSHLANHIRYILQEIDGRGENSNPWTVTALPRSTYPVGTWPQPIQADISCRSMDILLSEPSSLEDAYEDRMELVNWLFRHFRAFMSNQDYVESIYSDRLIGFALNYPAIPNGETSYIRLNVQEFHLPEIKEWEKIKTEFVRTKFYHGPLLALDRVAEVVKAYKEMIQEIPNDTFPDIYAKIGLAATKAAAGVLPDLMEKVFLPIIQNQYRRAFQADYLQHSLLKDIDRSTVDDLIYRYTPPVVRCMEEVLDALENMAMDTKSREPCPRQTCDVLSKIYQLKRKTPALTAMLMFLADKKAQQKFIWGTAAGLIVFSGIILCAAPVTAGFYSPTAFQLISSFFFRKRKTI